MYMPDAKAYVVVHAAYEAEDGYNVIVKAILEGKIQS
jgi:hypothetical protein